jgi:putative hemolysin
MALVVDEYGDIQGIITLHDLLEVVMGEFASPDENDAWAIQREDGSWLLDGAIPIPELQDILQLAATPEQGKGRYHTLSGMIMLLTGHIPRTGEIVDWGGWRYEVVDMDAKKIDKVLARPLPSGRGEAA